MPILVAKNNGSVAGKLDLIDGQEYIIGRAEDCALVLAEEVGVSRYHFKLVQKDGGWVASGLSRFMPLRRDGEPVEEIELSEGVTFSAPPYVFQLETEAVSLVRIEPAPIVRLNPAPIINVDAATELGTVVRRPCLTVHYGDKNQSELIALEGNHWVAGRDSESELPIRDNRASRSHFEIFRMRENFFLVDLGSANGTHVNGQRVPEHEPLRLESGDVISISGVEMTFEIRSDLPNSGPSAPPPIIAKDHALFPKEAGLVEPKKLSWRFNAEAKMLFIIIMVAVGSVGFHVWRARSVDAVVDKNLEVNARLNPEQKLLVKDTFSLAQSLYVNGKFQLCLAELTKLHQMVPALNTPRSWKAFANRASTMPNARTTWKRSSWPKKRWVKRS